jgi:hypothetical protein
MVFRVQGRHPRNNTNAIPTLTPNIGNYRKDLVRNRFKEHIKLSPGRLSRL